MTFISPSASISLMQARILNQSEEHLWSEFLDVHPLASIHQTPEWGHFQSKVPGRGKYWVVVLEDFTPGSQIKHDSGLEQGIVSNQHSLHQSSSTKIVAGTLLIRQQLPHGYSWLYAPRGPLLNFDPTNNYHAAQLQMSTLLAEIKKIAKTEKSIFFRIDPLIEQKSARAQILPQNSAKESHSSFCSLPTNFTPLHFPHFRRHIHGFQPDHTLILDLSKSEEQLLQEMKPKGRYNIHLAEKKGVQIIKSTPSDPEFKQNLSSFFHILTETTSRDGFSSHDEDFYKNLLMTLGDKSMLYLAKFEGQIIAGSINTVFKDVATYYYGASSNTYRNVMAPYLLHWQAIKDAKAAGQKSYDFFGIAPTHEHSECASQQVSPQGTDPKRPKEAKARLPAHPWAGVTEFKKKFGGTEISYQKPQEFVFKKALYFFYRAYKKLR